MFLLTQYEIFVLTFAISSARKGGKKRNRNNKNREVNSEKVEANVLGKRLLRQASQF